MFKSPRALPSLSMIISDLAVKPSDVAKHLGVTERTVWAWKASDTAPRPAMLALYWETRWGRSQMDTGLFNEAQVHRTHAQALQRENERLRGIIARMEQILPADTANHPLFTVDHNVNRA